MKIKDLIKDNENLEQVISILKTKTVEVPSWDKLKKEYFPSEHSIMSNPLFADKVKRSGLVKTSRVTRRLQGKAVDTMTGMIFGLPVERVYTFNSKSEAEQEAARIMDKIFLRNRIDSINIDRGIKYFASCEAATLWYAVPAKPHDLYGEPSTIKLRCRTFSPMTNESIYPYFDEYDDLVALAFEYTRKEGDKDVTYLDVYTETEHYKFKTTDGVPEIVEEEINGQKTAAGKEIKTIGKIPAIYANRQSPVWEDSKSVEEIEYTLSRNGNIIRKNSAPPFVISSDEKVAFGDEKESDDRKIIKLKKGETAKYETWQQATDALKFHVKELEAGFFSDIQLPNLSSDEMRGGNASGESKKYMFMDAHLKVIKEQGKWLEFFDREFNVVREFAKIMFPKYAKEFSSLEVKHIIVPFSMTEESETVKNTTTALTSGACSRRTAVKRLNFVQDIEQELEEIENDNTGDIMEKFE